MNARMVGICGLSRAHWGDSSHLTHGAHLILQRVVLWYEISDDKEGLGPRSEFSHTHDMWNGPGKRLFRTLWARVPHV